ncbi:MAG: hypothetical protein M1829_003938 [Trizodia sp. TS-e1964]|nr:MAG: hypothetical protein M1829_003938 [Trizodia sp. TS-e1964]
MPSPLPPISLTNVHQLSRCALERRPSPFPCIKVASFTASAKLDAKQELKHRYRDPYILAQVRKRKAANIARQKELTKERAGSLGDPVRGITTPFIESFDNNYDMPQDGNEAANTTPSKPSLNHFVAPSELEASLAHSYRLTKPLPGMDRGQADPEKEAEEAQTHQMRHENAAAAISRILSLTNGNSQDRTRRNVQRCIDTFGRHHTDNFLAPKPPSNVPRDPLLPPAPTKTPRAGPDTGSSEVQIAILTAKIRVLSTHLESQGGKPGGGRKDKVNKRNLRLLVHKRQKLLIYMRRKERGGERWQNLINTLGLTRGTWEGEISL